MKLQYAQEKLKAAVEVLASGKGPVQARLGDAFQSQAFRLQVEDLPEDDRDDFNALHAALTKVEDKKRGSIMASADALTDDEAAAMATKLVWLCFNVLRAYWEEQEQARRK